MQWLLAFSAALCIVVLSYLWSLISNYRLARSSGLPVFISPTNPANPLWMVFGGMLLPLFARALPDSAWNRIRYSCHGWQFFDWLRPLSTPATSFMLVTPGTNEIWVGDPDMAKAILVRTKDFVSGQQTKNLMNVFGPNVFTTEGKGWQRHRKIVGAALGERINETVWKESCQQAAQMLDDIRGETGKTVDALRNLAMQVLGVTGYGGSTAEQHELDHVQPGHVLSYLSVLKELVRGFMFVYVIPDRLLRMSFMPEALQKLGHAAREFPLYTAELLERERQLSTESEQLRKSFLSTLVKLSDNEKHGTETTGAGHLSEDEIRGNLFVFTVAGFDTTANTMAYAIAMLALYPEWQEWIFEEVQSVLSADGVPVYEETFPKLVRCLALMYEVLRIFLPLSQVSRSTTAPQILHSSTTAYHIPANTKVYINLSRLHLDRAVWGADAAEFRPDRWLAADAHLGSTKLTTPSGRFLPWSGGPRVCPGMKMAQTEFVAVVATLVRGHRVRPVRRNGETEHAARERTWAVVKDSQPRLTLQMNRPTDLELAWVRR